MQAIEKTPNEIVDLLKKQGIFNSSGNVTLNLMGVSAELKDKSAIGYVFQEWFACWLKKNNILFRVNTNSQEFPDFYLDKESNEEKLLEVKTFDYDAGPNFDVANFDAYCRSVKTKAYRLDADYLIFGYTFRDGVLEIKDIWLKKIWEITCPSERFPIRTQVKQGIIYNIRPAKWYSNGSRNPIFKSEKEFLKSLFDTIKIYKSSDDAKKWIEEVNKSLLNYKKESIIL